MRAIFPPPRPIRIIFLAVKSDTWGNSICSFYNQIALDLSRGDKHLIPSRAGVSVPLALLLLKAGKCSSWRNPKITQIPRNLQKCSLLWLKIHSCIDICDEWLKHETPVSYCSLCFVRLKIDLSMKHILELPYKWIGGIFSSIKCKMGKSNSTYCTEDCSNQCYLCYFYSGLLTSSTALNLMASKRKIKAHLCYCFGKR